jgi:ATP-dependent helicase HrpA
VEVKTQIKKQKNALALVFTLSDVQQQLEKLFYPGFLYVTPNQWLQQYPRYLRAILSRLEKASLNPQKEKLAIAEIQLYWNKFEEYTKKKGDYVQERNAALQEYRWWVEELRVSLFAQSIKTLVSISSKRLDKQWELVMEEVV